jgi:hypothetical protein
MMALEMVDEERGRVGLQLPSTVSKLSARLADMNVADLSVEV